MASKKQIAAGQRRRLSRIANELRQMSLDWGDVDFGKECILDALANRVQEAIPELYTEESTDE